MKNLKIFAFNLCKKICFLISLICVLFTFANAQSTNQNAPTAIITNEISGTIPARDIGDSRLTNYFYTFNGNQGDVFINVVTQNLDGDIDIFTIDGLKSLTKITVFSDNSDGETGRVVYLRKFEKLLLRIQGRSPNDDPATFKIKFAGSFQALQNTDATEPTKLPEIDKPNRGEIRVNSVGTIIEIVPKPTPEPKVVAENEPKVTETKSENLKNIEINIKSVDEKIVSEDSTRIEIKKEKKEEVTQTSKVETSDPSKTNIVISEDKLLPETKSENENSDVNKIEPNQKTNVELNDSSSEKTALDESRNESKNNVVRPLKIEELQNIELVVKFKSGKLLKQSMSKVFSFNVNQGILTIIMYDGNISKYSLLEIEKVSIEGN